MTQTKDQATICFFIKYNKVMLILIDYDQADGFGGQKWTGPGGHLDKKEPPKTGAVREIKEEVGLDVAENDLKKVLLVKGDNNIMLHIFIVSKWRGKLKTNDPTIKKVKWFDFDKIPYAQMHKGNSNWLPQILSSL